MKDKNGIEVDVDILSPKNKVTITEGDKVWSIWTQLRKIDWEFRIREETDWMQKYFDEFEEKNER